MHHALTAPAVLSDHRAQTHVVDLRSRLHACAANEQMAWLTFQRQLEQTLAHNSHELHVDVNAECLRLRIKTLGGFIETRLPEDNQLNDALSLVHKELWPDQGHALSRRAWFLLKLHKRDYLFQVDYVQTSSGSTFTLRRLYDVQNPLPQLEQLVSLPAQASNIRQRIQRAHGLILLADTERTSRVRTARALAQCLTSPERRILLSETTCHPLVPGITQITLPQDAQREHQHAWLQACDMSHDVIIALEIDHEPALLTRLASESSLVVQGVAANCASQALAQMIASGTRPEAIARVLSSILVQRRIALACEQCKSLRPLDDTLNDWVAQQNPVRPGAIQDWLAERLADSFVEAAGCEACSETGVGEVILTVDCVDLDCDVQDALCDGDVRYAMDYLDKTNAFPAQLAQLARMGRITVQHAIELADPAKRQGR